MRIETDRLIIRSLRTEDEQAYIQMASDGSLTEIFGDCSECRHWMGRWIAESIQLEKENNPGRAYLAYTVERKTDHAVIGSVGSTYYEDLGKIGITYFLGADYRGHSYMTEAVKGYAQYFFRSYNADTLFATARVENRASCRTLENAGFHLLETRLYQDLYDETAQLSNFYELLRLLQPSFHDTTNAYPPNPIK